MRQPYEAPRLVAYGRIADCTFATPGGNIKGGGPCFDLDKYGEMSGIPCPGTGS